RDTRDRVELPQPPLETQRERLQEPVARRVAPAVVDELEGVEIDVQHGQLSLVTPRLSELELEALVEPHEVRELRERIRERPLLDLRIVALAGGDVDERADRGGPLLR